MNFKTSGIGYCARVLGFAVPFDEILDE